MFPLTAAGFVVLCASIFAGLVYGVQREDRVLIVAGVAGIVLLLTCLLLTTAGALWAWLATRDRSETHLELLVGRPGRTGFQLTTPLWLPLVDLRWRVPGYSATQIASGRTLAEQWTVARRGRATEVERWFTVGDVFGLCALEFPVTSKHALRFLPAEGALRKVEVIRGLASGDQFAHPEGRPQGDLQDIRNYGAGDPIRYVLWKVFAKSRTLVVRTPERALSPIHRTAAYLIAGADDQAAAGTAKTAVECGALGAEWRFGADGVDQVATEARGAVELILDSAASDAPAAGLGRFIASADNPRRVVVFAPATPGPWVDAVLAVSQHTKLQVLLCVDVIAPRPSALKPLFLQADPANPGEVRVSKQELASLVRRLAGVGSVQVVDRRTGTVFGAAHLQQLTAAA